MEGRVDVGPLLPEAKDGRPTRAKGAPPGLPASDSEHKDRSALQSFPECVGGVKIKISSRGAAGIVRSNRALQVGCVRVHVAEGALTQM